MLPTIRHLSEIARRCKEGQPLPAELSVWLASGLEAFLAHHVHSLDEALGLRAARGGIPWWKEVANRQRDEALRELAKRYCSGISVTAQAVRIAALSSRYAGSAWRFDRDRSLMPDHYRGTPSELLWLAFKSCAHMPIGERQLRAILVGRASGYRTSVLRPPGLASAGATSTIDPSAEPNFS